MESKYKRMTELVNILNKASKVYYQDGNEIMSNFEYDKLYDEWNVSRPLPILNATIDKRYRQKGYQVVFALYPDRELYGIEQKDRDKIMKEMME